MKVRSSQLNFVAKSGEKQGGGSEAQEARRANGGAHKNARRLCHSRKHVSNFLRLSLAHRRRLHRRCPSAIDPLNVLAFINYSHGPCLPLFSPTGTPHPPRSLPVLFFSLALVRCLGHRDIWVFLFPSLFALCCATTPSVQ